MKKRILRITPPMDGLLFILILAGSFSLTLATKHQVPASEHAINNNYDVKHHTEPAPQLNYQHDQQYLQYHHLHNNDNLAAGIIEGEGWHEDDDGYWDGVETVDLTQKTPPHREETQLYLVPLSPIDQQLPDHSSIMDCGDESFCDAELFPAPPKLDMPPPPLPPFMPGLVSMIRRESLEVFIGVPPQSHCSLCQWAEEGEAALTSLIEESDDSEDGGDGGGVVGLVAGVAVGSALTGAVLMAVLIRCRRAKMLPTVRDSCPMLPRTSWHKSSQANRPEPPKPNPVAPSNVTGANDADTTSRTGWAMKLWRRGSSQERPLRPASSYSSENSYTGEPYVHPDAQSAVYAELAQELNTYSEIPDPGMIVQHNMVISDYGYGNSAYALSETPSEPADSSSTPSSAYYSDVSTDGRASKKKRKKKKSNDKDNIMVSNCNFANMPANISSTIPIMSSRVGENIIPYSAGNVHTTVSSHDVLPLSLRFIGPHSYSLDRQGIAYACGPCHSCTPISTLPIIRHPCEINTMVLNPNSRGMVSHILPGNDPVVKYAVRTSANQAIHDPRSHATQRNPVLCSPERLSQVMNQNQAMTCRQEQQLPCPPSEYV